MSMDGSPIIDHAPVDGLYLNGGWCYGGFKATPASGWCFAHLIAHDRPHETSLPTGLTVSQPAISSTKRARARSPTCIDRHHSCSRPGNLMRIPCPFCGERDLTEFAYFGDADIERPNPMAADAESQFVDAVYMRDNPAGPHDELWYHAPVAEAGCA